MRGARILATLAPFADEMTVYPGHPLPADATDAYALSFAIPMDTPGLIFLCRDSAAAVGANPFDHPFSTRFDEQDAFAIFDDVEVPSDRVFIDGDIDVYNSVMGPTAWWPNIMQQTTIRALDQAGVRLRPRAAHGRGGQRQLRADRSRCSASCRATSRSPATRSCCREEHAYDRGDGVSSPTPGPMHPMRVDAGRVVSRGCARSSC